MIKKEQWFNAAVRGKMGFTFSPYIKLNIVSNINIMKYFSCSLLALPI